MSIESQLSDLIFFPSVKSGLFDYNINIKSNLKKFLEDNSTEPTPSLLEYLCYSIVKNQLLVKNYINPNFIITNENFLSNFNSKNFFMNSNKKHIIIFIQNENTKKWNLIMFLNFKEQVNNYININNEKPIMTKIISSNLNSDEDNNNLDKILDSLEKCFDFKSSYNIKYEINSVSISDQKNSSVFLLNFIEGLICQNNNENLFSYIQKLFDEPVNINDQHNINENDNDINYIDYFNSFNKRNKIFDDILSIYEKELKEYLSNKVKNIFNIKKYPYKSKENIKNEMTHINAMIRDNNNKNNNSNYDEDDDLNSDDEEEVLKIMEKENNESKKKLRERNIKLKYNLFKQKINLEDTNIFRDFGVIKEEENESSSESLRFFSPSNNLNKKQKIIKKKIDLKFKKLNKSNKNVKKELKIKTDYKTNDIKNDNNNQNIKKNVLKELEEAVKEFELEEDHTFKTVGSDTDENKNNKIKSIKTNLKKNKKEKNYDIYKIIKNSNLKNIKKIFYSKRNEREKKRGSLTNKNNSKNKSMEYKSEEHKNKDKTLIKEKLFNNCYRTNKETKRLSLLNKKFFNSKDKKRPTKKNKYNSLLYSDKCIIKKNVNRSLIINDKENKILKETSLNKYTSHNSIGKKCNVIFDKNTSLIKILSHNNIKKNSKGKNPIKVTKLSSNSQKSTSYRSEESHNNLKLQNQDIHLKNNLSNDLEIKIEKKNTSFTLKEDHHTNKVNDNLSKLKKDKNDEYFKLFNEITIQNYNSKNRINNIKKLEKKRSNNKDLKYNKNTDIKIKDNYILIENDLSFDTFRTINDNEKETIKKSTTVTEPDFRKPKLKKLDNEFIIPISPRKRNKKYLKEINIFDEDKMNKMCGCISKKNNEFCNIF